MSDALETLKKEILGDAEVEGSKLREDAEKEASEILQKASEEVTKTLEQLGATARDKAETAKRQEMASATLAIKMKLLEEKETLIDKVFQQAFKRVEKISETSDYAKILLKLAIEGGNVLEGGNLTVFLRKIDLSKFDAKEAAAQISKKTGNHTTIDPKSSSQRVTSPGLIIGHESIWVDNTLEAIFDRRKEKIREKMAKILLGE